MSDIVDQIFDRYGEYGDQTYLGEPVTLTEHMLQTAQLAEAEQAEPQLVVVALLHDYGHLIHDEAEDAAEHGLDTLHEEVGFRFLRQHFPPEVVEPVRLHVAAKRYLCAVDSDYNELLSPASKLSLELQGGPMSLTEIEEFERSPYAPAACRLRRWDDAGKSPATSTPDFERYRSLVESFVVG